MDGHLVGTVEHVAQPQLIKKRRKAMLKIQMFIHKLMNPLQNNEGATAVEYGIMVSLISVAILATVGLLGGALNGIFAAVVAAL